MDERNAYALTALYLASLAFYVWAVDRIKNGRG